jgi:cytochrome oxidase assembly protein ShyY1
MGSAAGPLRFDLEWRLTLFTALFLPLLVALGFWQLDREAEKRALAERFASRQAQPPAALTPALARRPPQELAYLPVHLRGRFLPDQYLLLDNRVRDGRFGYEVVALFALAGGAGYALVNRGWIAGDPARRSLPEVTAPVRELSLRGHLYVPPDPPYLLAEQSLATDDWPRVVQALEAERLASALTAARGAPVFPWSVRMDAGQPGALAAGWPVVNVTPEKHRGYAVQWFTMAGVLLLFFLLRSSNLWALLRGTREPQTGGSDD